ncbi:NEW3 domain-containing protein [Actinoallomurus acaciae]|uniref:NEW3 domain-containing protein n=1 Tax=Actinoallomurus acaciae TaxID=502577 RepID=A0ABV5YSJ5_9ACTN
MRLFDLPVLSACCAVMAGRRLRQRLNVTSPQKYPAGGEAQMLPAETDPAARRVTAVACAFAVVVATAGLGAAPASAAREPGGLPPRHEVALFESTYRSLAERVTARGYAPTSLAGYYAAMYTRDSSVNALALLLGGDDARARAILRYIFRYSAASGQARMPHRIYQESDTPTAAGEQTDVSAPTVSFRGPGSRATQPMPAPGLVTATDVWLDRTPRARGTVRATLLAGTGPDAQVVDTTGIATSQIPAGGGWVTLRFLPPLFSSPPAGGYSLRLEAPDTPPGSVTWRGAADGTLSYRERITDFTISGYDMYDETDQAYSVLLAWSRYVRANPGDRAFVAETWPYVRRYADYYLDTPGYLDASLDLIRNPILDDEGYHDTYDLLTNVFTSQALHELAPIADRLGDPADARRWQSISKQIERGIDTNLVTTVDGKRIYGEKYEVTEGNRFHPGYSFANLAPIAVDWYALDTRIMADTLRAYLAHESRDWSGVPMLSSMHDYAFTGHNDWVLTKGLAWEWRFDQENRGQDRIPALDAFLRHYYPDETQPISEGWILDSDGNLRVTDPGNQEHAGWYAIEMLETHRGLRETAGSLNASMRRTPSLYVAASTSVIAGTPFTVTATLYNTTGEPVDYQALRLRGPAGWAVTGPSVNGGQLAPGDPIPVTWTVTPPADAPAGPAALTVTTRTTARHGGVQKVSGGVTVTVATQ